MSVPLAYTLVLLTFAGTSVCTWRALNAWRDRRTERRAQALADARQRVGLPPAAVDNVPGSNLADLNECVQILTYTDELDAGCARLWDALAEHREEEK